MQLLGIVRDITATKQAELALAADKEMAEMTLGSIGDGVLTTDPQGVIQSMNRVAEQMCSGGCPEWTEQICRTKGNPLGDSRPADARD